MKVEEKNMGLPTNFRLVNGKFELRGGEAQVDNNLFFFISFMTFFRIFNMDFIPNVLNLFMKDTNYIEKYKNTFRLSILDTARKYIINAVVEDVDIPINYFDRKSITISIKHRYRKDSSAQSRAVTFIKTI